MYNVVPNNRYRNNVIFKSNKYMLFQTRHIYLAYLLVFAKSNSVAVRSTIYTVLEMSFPKKAYINYPFVT